MENYYKFYVNITEYNGNFSKLQIHVFESFSSICSLTITLINLISIVIICFQKGKFNIIRKIQLFLCITFIGIEIRFYPIRWNNQNFYIIQNGACFSFIIISNYYQYIYSFIAYKLFTAPDDLLSKYSIFKIYYFPFILLIIINFFLNTDGLKFIFKFRSYSDLSYISKVLLGIFRAIFFILNIVYICLLMKKIKKISNIAIPVDKTFAQKKYAIYKSVLTWYIIGMFIVVMPYILLYSFQFFMKSKNEKENEKLLLKNYYFSFFFLGIECMSGFIYWVIYIYNRNLIRRLLILFCCKHESEYLNDFIEEKRIYEESVKGILTTTQTIDLSALTSSINEEENKKQIKESPQEHYIESLTDDETL